MQTDTQKRISQNTAPRKFPIETRREQGFTLVETLVAIAVLLVAIVGPMSIAAQGLQASFFAREQTTAVYLAQEAVEAIVHERNAEALEAMGGNSPRVFSLCRAGVLPASPGDDFYGRYPDPDICERDTWQWYDRLTANSGPNCDGTNGCDYESTTGDFHACGSGACTLLRDTSLANGRYYQYAGGDPSAYTRVIRLEPASGSDDEVLVTVEVSWKTTLFSGNDSSVTLQTRIFDQYE